MKKKKNPHSRCVCVAATCQVSRRGGLRGPEGGGAGAPHILKQVTVQAFPTVPAAHNPPPPTSWGAVNTCAVACRSEDERLQFMRGLQDVWSVSGRPVLGAFDLSPFPLICDVGGEPLPCTPEQGLRAGDLGAPGGEGRNTT